MGKVKEEVVVAVEEATTSSLEELVAVIEGGGATGGKGVSYKGCVVCTLSRRITKQGQVKKWRASRPRKG